MTEFGDDGRPVTFAECLEITIDFLHMLDKAVGVLAQASGQEPPAPDRTMQADLSAAAAFMAEHPEIDQQIMAAMRGDAR